MKWASSTATSAAPGTARRAAPRRPRCAPRRSPARARRSRKSAAAQPDDEPEQRNPRLETGGVRARHRAVGAPRRPRRRASPSARPARRHGRVRVVRTCLGAMHADERAPAAWAQSSPSRRVLPRPGAPSTRASDPCPSRRRRARRAARRARARGRRTGRSPRARARRRPPRRPRPARAQPCPWRRTARSAVA